VESYVGSIGAGQGVKLEDQYLITETGAERMTTLPFDPALV
jgi:Xaa-Pro dipeptidase